MKAPVLAATVRILTGANVRWLNCQPESRQRIYFSNHTSHLDAVVLWASLPLNVRNLTRPVAAQDYWAATKLRRCMARVLNVILIERRRVAAGNNPIRTILAAMDDRFSIILFPEGGRSAGPNMRPFKSGLFHLARKRPEIELVPVYIDNLNRILPKGEVLPVPMLSHITFGPPLRLRPGEMKQEFLARAQAAILELREP